VTAAGILLDAGAVLFCAGAASPSLTPIWSASRERKLELLADRHAAWRRTSLLFLAANTVTLPGLALLAQELACNTSSIGLWLAVPGATLWSLSLLARLTIDPLAAREPELRPAHRLVSAWSGACFSLYTVLINTALLLYGVAVVRTSLLAHWAGWISIVVSALLLLWFARWRDGIPALYHAVPCLLGVLLLLH
jgi:hypothetical protein